MKIMGMIAAVVLLAGCSAGGTDETLVDADQKPTPTEDRAQGMVSEVDVTFDLRDPYYACAGWIEDPYTGAGRVRGAEFLELEDDGTTIVVEGLGDGMKSFDAGWCVLEQTEAPTSVLAKVETTNDPMGRQSDSWTTDDGTTYEATWTYGDAGLDMVVEAG